MRRFILIILALTVIGAAAAENTNLKMTGKIKVSPIGDARFDATLDLNAAQYSQAAKMYKHNPYELVRDLQTGGGSTPGTAMQGEVDPDSVKIDFIDKDTDVRLSLNFIGAAYYSKDGWVLHLDKGAKMLSQNNGTLVFTADVEPSNPLEVGVSGDYTVELPKDATNPKFNSEKGILTYATPVPTGPTKGAGTAAMVGSFVVALVGLIVAGSSFFGRGSSVPVATTTTTPVTNTPSQPAGGVYSVNPEQETTPSPMALARDETPAFCSGCGTKFSGGEAFCPKCGRAVTDADEKRKAA